MIWKKAITNFKNGNYDNHRVFILVKEPSIILNLIDAGIEIPEVNVGMIFDVDDRKKYTDHVSLNKNELNDLKEINEKNVPVYFQYTPDDKKISLMNLIK